MALLLAQLALAALGSSTAPIIKVLVRMLWIADFFVVYCMLGWEQYTLCLGPYSVWKRLLATCYFWQLSKYREPDWSVHKYLVVMHSAAAFARPASGWYWAGSLICWLAVVCMDAWGGAFTACSAAAALHCMTSAASSSRCMLLLVDLLVPGLVLAWFELKARKSWMQQQRQHPARQRIHIAPAAAAATRVPAAATQQLAEKQPAEEAPKVGASLTCSSSSSSQMAEQAGAKTLQPGGKPLTEEAPQLGAVLSHSSSSSSSRQSAIQPMALPTAAAAPAALAPAGVAEAGCDAAAGSNTGSAAAAAVAAVGDAVQQRSRSTRTSSGSSLLYRSPVGRRVVSFKFTQAPGKAAAVKGKVHGAFHAIITAGS
jgi:hypothetical protein